MAMIRGEGEGGEKRRGESRSPYLEDPLIKFHTTLVSVPDPPLRSPPPPSFRAPLGEERRHFFGEKRCIFELAIGAWFWTFMDVDIGSLCL